jgi:hypothetical protein
MIALALGQVKDPPEGEARNGLEVRDLAGLLPRGLTGLQSLLAFQFAEAFGVFRRRASTSLFSFASAPAPGTLRESDGTLSSGLPLEDRESVSVQ